MRRHSLSVRLLGFAALTTLIVLFTTSLIFNQLFEDYFQRRLQSELATQLQQLTANLSVSSSGEIVVKEMSDIRFSQPLSGYYWQIQRSTGAPIISRSLWDQPIEVAAPMEQGVAEARTVYPPGAEPLLALTWSISVNGTATPEVLVMTVASNLSEIKVFAAGFRRNITVWLAMLGVALMMAAWAQVRLGLRPLDAIRSEIRKIRDAPGRTLEGNFPTEVNDW